MNDLVPGVYRKGEPGFIEPGSELHRVTISPSKVAAIMGVSRWESAYQLWHRMKGITPQELDKDDFVVGHAVEPMLAYLWRHENEGWQLSRGEVQYIADASRFGFPFVCTLDRRARRGQLRRIVEFKSCRGWDEWDDDPTDEDPEIPPDYRLQVIAQQLFTGFTSPAHLKVLNKFGCYHHTYNIEFSQGVADLVVAECRAFYESLSSDTAPPLDDSITTYNCVREKYRQRDLEIGIERGVEVDIPAELGLEYHDALSAEAEAVTRARFAKTQVLDLMGYAQYAVAGDQRVARRQRGTNDSVSLYAIKPDTKAAMTRTDEQGAVA